MFVLVRNQKRKGGSVNSASFGGWYIQATLFWYVLPGFFCTTWPVWAGVREHSKADGAAASVRLEYGDEAFFSSGKKRQSYFTLRSRQRQQVAGLMTGVGSADVRRSSVVTLRRVTMFSMQVKDGDNGGRGVCGCVCSRLSASTWLYASHSASQPIS